jgi:transcriptional regulator with XRE-family HTH domain
MAKKVQSKKRKPTIGEMIRKTRERKKISAITLARDCEVTRAAIYQWEASDRLLDKNLRRLADALGVNIDRLRAINDP